MVLVSHAWMPLWSEIYSHNDGLSEKPARVRESTPGPG